MNNRITYSRVLLTAKEVSDALHVDPSTVYNWIRDKTIPREYVVKTTRSHGRHKYSYYIKSRWLDNNTCTQLMRKITRKEIKQYNSTIVTAVMNAEHYEDTMSIKEVSEALGVSFDAVFKWSKDGVLIKCTCCDLDVGNRFSKKYIEALKNMMFCSVYKRDIAK